MLEKLPGRKSLLALVTGLIACSAESGGDAIDDDGFTAGKADGRFSDCSTLEILVLINSVQDEDELEEVGISPNVAEEIIDAISGDDAEVGTEDDVFFVDLEELDDVPFVGKQTFDQLLEAVSGRCEANGDSVHLRMGVAKDGTPEDDAVFDRPDYALSYNHLLNGPNWVSWRLVADDFGVVPRYAGNFLADVSLPKEWYRPIDGDYTNSGFQRGHVVRSEERTSTVAANKATFLLSNVLPQTGPSNTGPWLKLELFAQALATSKDAAHDLYVIAGAVWPKACSTHKPRAAGDGCKDIGRSSDPGERLAVPEAMFKIVVVVEPGASPTKGLGAGQTIAVIVPNNNDIQDAEWTDFVTTVDEIEKRTGYDFLAPLSAATEKSVEAQRFTCDGNPICPVD